MDAGGCGAGEVKGARRVTLPPLPRSCGPSGSFAQRTTGSGASSTPVGGRQRKRLGGRTVLRVGDVLIPVLLAPGIQGRQQVLQRLEAPPTRLAELAGAHAVDDLPVVRLDQR